MLNIPFTYFVFCISCSSFIYLLTYFSRIAVDNLPNPWKDTVDIESLLFLKNLDKDPTWLIIPVSVLFEFTTKSILLKPLYEGIREYPRLSILASNLFIPSLY